MEIKELGGLLLPRRPDGNKSDFGHALLIAGSYGMAGASVLAGRACLRSGVGKLSMHIPRCNNDIVQLAVPEAVVRHDSAESPCFSAVPPLQGYDAVAVGPGLGQQDSTAMALEGLLEALRDVGDVPVVLDADALNLLARHPGLWALLPPDAILTPHLGEFARLLHCPLPSLVCDAALQGRLAADLARERRVTVVLKGHGTRIFSPDGREDCCPWGNDGMATAGSGDVLTGIILGLLAQGHRSFEAACLGVALHALSGDAAAGRMGHHALIASDLIECMPMAFRQIVG